MGGIRWDRQPPQIKLMRQTPKSPEILDKDEALGCCLSSGFSTPLPLPVCLDTHSTAGGRGVC